MKPSVSRRSLILNGAHKSLKPKHEPKEDASQTKSNYSLYSSTLNAQEKHGDCDDGHENVESLKEKK